MSGPKGFTVQDARKISGLRRQLERCAASIALHSDTLDVLYAERNGLYEQLVALGVRKVDVAVWAGSSADAVAKALAKLAG